VTGAWSAADAAGLHVEVRGPAVGTPLLLVHGIGGSWRNWEPCLETLATAGRRVLAIDLPGFGKSPPLIGRTDVAALAAAVARFVGRRPIDVAGNSLGGAIGFELARLGRASRVVAISPIGAGTTAERAYAHAVLAGERLVARAALPIIGPLVAPPVVRRVLGVFLVGDGARVPAGAGAEAVRGLARAPAFWAAVRPVCWHRIERPDEITVPVRLLWGSRDRLHPPWQGRRLAAALPDARLELLSGLGHVPMLEDGPRVARRILAALG
jgi:pimeloyl-ACP methyl ester carboxylesterase